ncbi:hypothetical protein [Microvirga sp. G4-2]|uniref:hypothetical protein n=1 Tax=Microvirga sp. G4-2 TaxID=3434467 RepID=UPI00404455F6
MTIPIPTQEDFDPKDPDTWPLLLELKEVAKVLRYKDVDSVRAITKKPVNLGGLAYRKEGRRRMVGKEDLLAYINRPIANARATEPTPKQMRRSAVSVGRKSFMARIGRAAA